MVKKNSRKLSFVTVKEMRRIDQDAVKAGMPIELMMENAGKSLAMHVKTKFNDLSGKRILCVAGKGNNGGGVIASVRHFIFYGAKVSLVLLYPKTALTHAPKFHLSILRPGSRLRITKYDRRNRTFIFSLIRKADIILDGIFGTGFTKTVKEPILSIISAINMSQAYVVSNDVPSGMDADTGKVITKAVTPDFTVVLHKPKKWMIKHELSSSKYSVESIGIPVKT